jgi:hypothetical protein
MSDGQKADMRNIRSPILVYCSEGDNITPPQQLHSIALSPQDALHGSVIEVGREGFLKMAHLAEPLMRNGGTMFAMINYGSQLA